MAASFFEQPVLNSPYEVPRFHHALDKHGQPLDLPPVEGRRRSEIITPVPMPRMQTGRSRQGTLALGDRDDASVGEQEYNPTPIINEIRNHVATTENFEGIGRAKCAGRLSGRGSNDYVSTSVMDTGWLCPRCRLRPRRPEKCGQARPRPALPCHAVK